MSAINPLATVDRRNQQCSAAGVLVVLFLVLVVAHAVLFKLRVRVAGAVWFLAALFVVGMACNASVAYL